jgi:hypothetical protein
MIKVQKLQIFIIPALLLIIMFAGTGFYRHETGKYNELEQQIIAALEDFKSYMRDPSKAPSASQLEELSKYRSEMQNILSQTLYTYKTNAGHEPSMNPLEFKEKLLGLQGNYSKLKIPIPDGFGFKEYGGYSLPQVDQMKVLTRQFHFIIQIIDLLIQNHVDAILDIKRLPIEPVQSTVSKKNIFLAYHFSISFKISHKNYVTFVDNLIAIPSLLRVENISIRSNYSAAAETSIESQLITLTMNICLMEYEE